MTESEPTPDAIDKVIDRDKLLHSLINELADRTEREYKANRDAIWTHHRNRERLVWYVENLKLSPDDCRPALSWLYHNRFAQDAEGKRELLDRCSGLVDLAYKIGQEEGRDAANLLRTLLERIDPEIEAAFNADLH